MNLNSKKPVYVLSECAIFIAVAIVLSIIPEIPIGAVGGSIGFGMIPLFIIAYRHGYKYSFISGFVFSILYVTVGGKWGYGLPSVLLDYVLAYTIIGIAGFFGGAAKCKGKLFEVGVFLGCLARYAVSVLSGVVLYGITTATEIGCIVTSNALIYSLIYNGLYMLPNTIIAIVAMALLRYPLKKLERI
ncbi:MAG: energy-coupled thiamine transporter ThiT [Clostridia bacterium]|nr:energy-coupled thiamine transporter ThiT [Clostridia bacterium]